MAVTITRTPDPVSLTSSPIVFGASSDLYGVKEYLKLNLRIEKWSGTQWIIVNTQTLSPGNAGGALFDVHNYLKTHISSSFSYPTAENNYKQHLNHRVVFKAAIWESYYEGGAIVNNTTVYSNQFWAIRGGIGLELEAQLNDRDKSFHELLLEEGKFLTWMPRTQTVSPDQPIRLFYLALPNIGSIIIVLVNYTVNGQSMHTYTAFIPPETGSIYEIMCGAAEIGLHEECTEYTVTLVDGGNNPLSETFTFLIDRSNYERNTFFLFQNSLNGYDTLWCRGLRSQKNKYSRTTVERSRAIDVSASDPTIVNQRGNRQKVFSQNTGIIKDDAMLEWMDEFFGSEKIYLIEEGSAVPVILTSNTYKAAEDFKTPRGIDISFTKAFLSESYEVPIADLIDNPGEFNKDFGDDYNIGGNTGTNNTPDEGTVLEIAYRCVVDSNGVNTGEQEKHTLLSDGEGDSEWTQWESIGNNVIACPLPPTKISLEIVSESETALLFRAVVDRNTATSDYTAYLNRSVIEPIAYTVLTNPEAIEDIPASLIILSGESHSNTVSVSKSKIYTSGFAEVELSSVSPAWLTKDSTGIQIAGTKELPIKIGLIQNWNSETEFSISLWTTRAVPQNVSCAVSINGASANYVIPTGSTSKVVATYNTENITGVMTFQLQTVPDGYYKQTPTLISYDSGTDPNA